MFKENNFLSVKYSFNSDIVNVDATVRRINIPCASRLPNETTDTPAGDTEAGDNATPDLTKYKADAVKQGVDGVITYSPQLIAFPAYALSAGSETDACAPFELSFPRDAFLMVKVNVFEPTYCTVST